MPMDHLDASTKHCPVRTPGTLWFVRRMGALPVEEECTRNGQIHVGQTLDRPDSRRSSIRDRPGTEHVQTQPLSGPRYHQSTGRLQTMGARTRPQTKPRTTLLGHCPTALARRVSRGFAVTWILDHPTPNPNQNVRMVLDTRE